MGQAWHSTPDLKVFTNGPIQVQALGAGSASNSVISVRERFGYRLRGKAKIIAMNALGLSDRVIAQAGINSIADLKGKKVGVPEGTSGDMLLRLALAKAGMQIGDIEVIKMDPITVVFGLLPRSRSTPRASGIRLSASSRRLCRIWSNWPRTLTSSRRTPSRQPSSHAMKWPKAIRIWSNA